VPDREKAAGLPSTSERRRWPPISGIFRRGDCFPQGPRLIRRPLSRGCDDAARRLAGRACAEILQRPSVPPSARSRTGSGRKRLSGNGSEKRLCREYGHALPADGGGRFTALRFAVPAGSLFGETVSAASLGLRAFCGGGVYLGRCVSALSGRISRRRCGFPAG
jgi:hypothetical protein